MFTYPMEGIDFMEDRASNGHGELTETSIFRGSMLSSEYQL